MQIPLDKNVIELQDIPYTISYVLRKRIQIDNLNELPKDKRPPEKMIWDGGSNELDNWLERVMGGKQDSMFEFDIDESEIG